MLFKKGKPAQVLTIPLLLRITKDASSVNQRIFSVRIAHEAILLDTIHCSAGLEGVRSPGPGVRTRQENGFWRQRAERGLVFRNAALRRLEGLIT